MRKVYYNGGGMPDFDDLIHKGEKKRKAVALSFEKGVDPAPRMVAKGEGLLAEQIVAIAREYGIDIHEDADLAEILGALEIDSFIPIEAYVAVAEILSYIYRRNRERSHGTTGSG